jgi:pimeloyl-ACP methyl ester carboxylesterase
MRAMMNDRIETKLPRIQAPTLVIRGEYDSIAPPRWTSHATAMLPHGRIVEIPNGSHCVHYAAPDSVAEAIRAFILESPVACPVEASSRLEPKLSGWRSRLE